MAKSVIYRRDVRALLREVAPTDSSVVIPVEKLYRVYLDQMIKQGREPVTRNAFSRALTQCGQRALNGRVNGSNTRHRVVHEKFMAGEQYDMEPARLSNRNR